MKARADFESELLAFPYGRYDDQVDALLLFLDWFAQNEQYIQPMSFNPPIMVRLDNPFPRPAEIRKALQDKGVAMPFTSIRHAPGQLEARNAAEPVGDSKTWRHRSGAS